MLWARIVDRGEMMGMGDRDWGLAGVFFATFFEKMCICATCALMIPMFVLTLRQKLKREDDGSIYTDKCAEISVAGRHDPARGPHDV